jgi:hypothetical protein
MTDGVTVMSLSASLLQEISAAMNHLCQTALNQELLCKFEKYCKFSSHVKAKLHKKKLQKTTPACISTLKIFIGLIHYFYTVNLPFILVMRHEYYRLLPLHSFLHIPHQQ